MTLVGRAVSSERGETYAACDVFHVRVIYMSIESYIDIYIYSFSVHMNNYTCIYQYVSSRVGGSKGAATARLLPYIGGTLTYTSFDMFICI